jgi:predicted aspartyl protease
MANTDNEKPAWLEVCLINMVDHEKKLSEELAADEVNMVTMKIKVDTGCNELALPTSLVKQLKLDYIDTVQVLSSTDNNIPIDRHGPVLIYWDGQVYKAMTYSMPSLDSALLGLKPLLVMRPDFDWEKNSLKRSILSFPSKRYYINFDDIYKVIGSDDKIKYFDKEHGVKINVTNEGGSKMLLIICANRFDINIDEVAKTISHFALSLRSVFAMAGVHAV